MDDKMSMIEEKMRKAFEQKFIHSNFATSILKESMFEVFVAGREAAIAAMQPVTQMSEDDGEFIHRNFKEYMQMSPRTPASLERDGDGDYELKVTQGFYNMFEHAYRKGIWRGAVRMQEQCAIDYDKLTSLPMIPSEDEAVEIMAQAASSDVRHPRGSYEGLKLDMRDAYRAILAAMKQEA